MAIAATDAPSAMDADGTDLRHLADILKGLDELARLHGWHFEGTLQQDDTFIPVSYDVTKNLPHKIKLMEV